MGALPLRDKPISDQCVEGKARYDHSRSTSPPPDTQFSYRGSPQITVRTVDAGTVAAETIAVATAEHGPNTPPATGPTAPPGRPPATSPADNQLSSDTPGGTSDQPAPKPTPRVGHHPVTG
ncbi:hypothetical protein L3Q67_25685 [Saccharothrix sp. AJ9571]|nr:hypothetical protein L3Q67_25685 [Saccharothrix sp. AJ9571]